MRDWSSIRPPYRNTSRSGSAAARCALSVALATLADGWCPFAVAPAQAEQWLGQIELPANFEVVLPPVAHLDPINEPNRAREILAETEAAGATIVSVVHAAETLDEYLEYLEALTTIKEKE